MNTKQTLFMCDLRIKEIAKEKKIPIWQVAKAAGYNRTSSYNQAYQRGLKVPQLEAIAELLEVEVADLFVRYVKCPHCGHKFQIKIKTEE